MSKGIKIFIIIATIILIAACITFGLLMNRKKTSITADQFKTKMEQKGYAITDANDQFSQYDFVKQVYIAGDNNYSYQIEFYELSDDENAIQFYSHNIEKFASERNVIETRENGKNFSKFTQSTAEKYTLIERVDNTDIYISVDANYKDEVNKVIEELGY